MNKFLVVYTISSIERVGGGLVRQGRNEYEMDEFTADEYDTVVRTNYAYFETEVEALAFKQGLQYGLMVEVVAIYEKLY